MYPKVMRGLEAELVNVDIVDGQLIIATDSRIIYADIGTERVSLGVDTSDANATPADILNGKIAYVKGKRVVGTIPSKEAATHNPGTSNRVIASAGYYLAGTQAISGDSDLKAGNIKSGVSLFGISGKLKGSSLVSWSRTSSGSYTFTQSGNRWTSNNKGVASSTATATWTINAPYATSYVLAYNVSSEANYDKFSVTINGNNIGGAKSGTSSGNLILPLVSGTNTLVAKYVKDGSNDTNSDRAYIDLPPLVT